MFLGCSGVQKQATPNSAVDKILDTKTNSKYRLTCVFRGQEISVGDRNSKVITSLSIRNNDTGEEVKYDNVPAGAVIDADALFTDVWSPDEEYFVSLLGRTQGFCMIKSSELMEKLKRKQCSDFLRVTEENGTALWHQFVKWESDGTIFFKAGLSNDLFPLKYDIAKHVLVELDSRSHSVTADNAHGRVPISKQ